MKTDLIRVMIEGLSCVDLCQSKDNWWNALNTKIPLICTE